MARFKLPRKFRESFTATCARSRFCFWERICRLYIRFYKSPAKHQVETIAHIYRQSIHAGIAKRITTALGLPALAQAAHHEIKSIFNLIYRNAIPGFNAYRFFG
jgi:hypothetical protein